MNGRAVGGENVQGPAILGPCSAVRAGTQPGGKLANVPDLTYEPCVGREGHPYLNTVAFLVCSL